ncbi:MAG: NTP transferase domain-containing protein, partial [Alphaproteobacteria bacterium]|nr:NTP transferase domain-containing protein [Alphaproteobacteria bacterium]
MSQTTSSAINILILAAGEGMRMGSELPKVLHTVGRRSMLCHVVGTALNMEQYIVVAEIVIVHDPQHLPAFKADITEEFSPHGLEIRYAEQTERRGTGHAVQCGLPHFQRKLPVLVLYGDQPLMGASSLVAMVSALQDHALCLATLRPDDPHGLGRLVQNPDGTVAAIVEEKDASDTDRQIRLCNAGVMALGRGILPLLDALEANNAAAEYYLTDLVALAAQHSLSVQHIEFPTNEMASVNTLAQLATAESLWQSQIRAKFLASGVQMLAP